MQSPEIVDSRLFVKFDLSDVHEFNARFGDDRANLADLATRLLLYDQLLIPTYDFGIIPILASWIGVDLLRGLLYSDAIALIRRKGLLGYVGNGNAISVISIEGRDVPLPWFVEATFGESATSLGLQLDHLAIAEADRDAIMTGVLERTQDLDYTNDFFIENIANESYRDVMGSPILSKYAWRGSKKRDDSGVDLRWLPQVEGNQVRVLRADGRVRDPVDMVLRVAEVNMELLMATQAGGADLLTAQGGDQLLKEKLRRAGGNEPILQAFSGWLELNSIPDLRSSVENGELGFDTLWKIRTSDKAAKFRAWLREASPSDGRELEQAYVSAISQATAAGKLPVKVLRFVITAAAGLIPGIGGLVGGAAAGAVDSFFVDRWLNGYSPKLFIDTLQNIEPDDENGET